MTQTSLYENHSIDGNNIESGPLPTLYAKLRSLKITLDSKLTDSRVPDVAELIGASMPPGNHLAAAAIQVLNGEDPSESMAKHIAAMHVQGLGQEVLKQAKLRRVSAINNAADAIIETIRDEVFEPSIDRLKELSEQSGNTWDLDTAIRAKDFTRAAVIDEANQLTARLKTADEARRLLHPGAFAGPAAYGLGPGASLTGQGSLAWWMQLLQDDVELGFPTLAEWHQLHNSDAHREHRAALKAKAASDHREPISLGYESRNR